MLAEYQRVCAMVDLDAVAYNMEQMRQNLSPGTKMIGVIKTDAYGHGAVQIARELERLDYVWGYAVATAEEAFILRRTGLKKQILLLGYACPYHYEELICNDIQLTLFREDSIEELAACARRMKKASGCMSRWRRGCQGSALCRMRAACGSWRRYCIRKVWCPRGVYPLCPVG